MMTIAVSIPRGVSAAELLANADGRPDLAVTLDTDPELVAGTGAPAIGWVTRAALGAGNVLHVTVEPVGTEPRIKSLIPVIQRDAVDQESGERVGARLTGFVATLDDSEDDPEDAGNARPAEDDDALDPDDPEEADSPRPLQFEDDDADADADVEAAKNLDDDSADGELGLLDPVNEDFVPDQDEQNFSVSSLPSWLGGPPEKQQQPLRQRGFPQRSETGRDAARATRRERDQMSEKDDEMDNVDANRLRLMIEAEDVPGDPRPTLAQRAIALVLRAQPQARALGEVELSRIAASLLRSAGIAQAERVLHLDINAAFALGRLANPKSVPLSATSRQGGGGATHALDLRGLPGRNRLERAIKYLEANRGGFRDLEWEAKIPLASQLLQTAPSVIDDQPDPVAEHRARPAKRTY
jgi:hypothetical protein